MITLIIHNLVTLNHAMIFHFRSFPLIIVLLLSIQENLTLLFRITHVILLNLKQILQSFAYEKYHRLKILTIFEFILVDRLL
jgi:hypothetical protein